jgi:hypothetical protein
MGLFGGDKTVTQSTTRIDPALESQGEYALGQARTLYDQQQPLPSMYTPMSPQRQQALGSMEQIAGNRAVSDPAMAEYQKTMSGQYMNPDSNPYLGDMVNRSVGAAMGSQTSGFASGGRFGSGAMSNAMADAGTATAERIYYGNYNAERNRQQQMMGMAPMMDQMQYSPEMMQGQIGAEYEQDELAKRMEAMRQYENPYAQLEQYQSYLTGNPLMASSFGGGAASRKFDWGSALTGAAIAGVGAAGDYFGNT